MKRRAASSTAALIARATVLLSHDERTTHLVPDEAARLSTLFLESLPGGATEVRRLRHGWYRGLAWAGERVTIPGLFVHFALRKRAIEELVRSHIAQGARQVIVLGAGFDTLASRLHRAFPEVRFFELDHPSTQALKRAALERSSPPDANLTLLPIDLRSTTPDVVLQAAPDFLQEAPSVVVIEGLLMYLPQEAVERTLRGLRQALGPNSTVVMTFMRQRPDGRIRFESQTWIASQWLGRRREPFLWASDPLDLASLMRRAGFTLEGEPREPGPAPAGMRLPGGEFLAVAKTDRGTWLNDVQTRLHPTRVASVLRPAGTAAVQDAVRQAARDGLAVSVAGGRHAQGGQQFAEDGLHLDMSGMSRILGLDAKKGIVHVQAGIQWPELIDGLAAMQTHDKIPWGIVQKQTGADKMSIGGALAANIHGRGLAFGPIVQDVEAFTLVDANGEAKTCSRTKNPEIFRLAIGGYGLFGVITEVWLRLRHRTVLERVVEVTTTESLMASMESRLRQGFLYGDFQYATDPASHDFLQRGVFSCYRPVVGRTPAPGQKHLSQADWDRLAGLAHTDRGLAFQRYAAYYLSTGGQVYDSDQHQLSTYVENYHQRLDAAMASSPACEVISELYAPRDRFTEFLADARAYFRRLGEAPIYGTIRLIERDEESFLAWAREPWVCTIVNLHVEHTAVGVRRAQEVFRGLFEIALRHGGSFYLTYHEWATREQVERAYPRFREFLAAKRRLDPAGRFQSEWYRHMVALFNEDKEPASSGG